MDLSFDSMTLTDFINFDFLDQDALVHTFRYNLDWDWD